VPNNELAARMTAERRSEIRKRADAATPGPWEAEEAAGMDCTWYDVTAPPHGDELFNGETQPNLHIVHPDYIHRVSADRQQTLDDVTFVANSRTDIPTLLDELDAVEAERDGFRNGVQGLREQLTDALDQRDEYWQKMHNANTHRETLVAERDAAIKERDALREQLAHYKWRPIADIHEDYGPCVLMRIDDPGYLEVGSNLDKDFNETGWTHFAEVPKLTIEEADDLAAAMEVSDAK